MSEARKEQGGTSLRRFNPYPAYKDSGVEWLGEIPEHWEVRRLKHLASLNPESLAEDTDPGLEMVYVDIGGVDSLGRIVEQQSLTFATAPSRARQLVRDGDVIVSTVRTYLRAIAPINDPEPNLVVSTGFAVVRPADDLTTDYAAYALRAPYFVERVVANSKGVSFPAINESEMARYAIAAPPPEEQRAIAAFLDRETARIDALVAKKERLIELLQEKRTTLITRAVTKGLDPNVPMKDSGVEWLGEIPAHWEAMRMRSVLSGIEQGWSPECEARIANDEEWGILKAGCVNRGLFVELEHKALPLDLNPIPALEVKAGDLLMSRASGSEELVGSAACVQSCRPRLLLSDKIFRLHPDSLRVRPRFLAMALNSRPVRAQIESALSGGSGLANNIPQSTVKDLILAIPQLQEQATLLVHLDGETAKIDTLVAKIHEGIDCLKEFRTALISTAVTGKIDVREAAA